jgi:hypothetical protein
VATFLVSFADGPVAGATLELRRAPALLRVVIDPAGGVDALDLLEDVPRLDEAIVVYRRLARPGGLVHVNRSRSAGGCAWYQRVSYGLLEGPQPEDEAVRGATAWRAWAIEHRNGGA